MREVEISRPYIDHLRAEHRLLHDEVRSIEKMLCDTVAGQGDSLELRRRLDLLSSDLRRHFTEEEAGGCLEEAVSRCPSAASQADALEAQHATLLARIERIAGRLVAGTPRENAESENEDFNWFAKDLLAHEAAENQIMQRAFGVTVNGEEE